MARSPGLHWKGCPDLMTKICLEQNTNAWFEMDGGGQVHLQTLTSNDFKGIKRQTTKKQTEFRRLDGKAERFEFDVINEDLQNELVWDLIILGWKDICDSNGKPIECTRANKIMLMNTAPKFSKFIMERLEKLKEEDARRIEETEKN